MAKKKKIVEEKTGFQAWLEKIKVFWEQAKGELKKVVWPTQKETMVTTLAVVILVVVLSLFLSLVDVTLAKVVAWILS
ncbi:preprotein translocase subunit SecE [Desulfonauticus submarinus]|uniref:Protein translocase subunit SecE n=1 Tax=Desulfonauticus submarinus TaxID=206665 RepID=A0A1H0GJ60_9BACT|nr:preprotein translocase subunit SecE [Desulfonauticus submarinus]SDO06903.1 preprotein translocase subunit SecE [Desulfonauticus submarinus]